MSPLQGLLVTFSGCRRHPPEEVCNVTGMVCKVFVIVDYQSHKYKMPSYYNITDFLHKNGGNSDTGREKSEVCVLLFRGKIVTSRHENVYFAYLTLPL